MDSKLKTLGKIIPPFFYPATDWKYKIVAACKAVDENIDLTDARVIAEILPRLICALPTQLLKLAPTDSLVNLLDWLDNFDKEQCSLESIMSLPFPTGTKPSIFFNKVFLKCQSALPTGTAKKTIEAMAWAVVRKGLPSSLQTAIMLLDPQKPPDATTWKRLDEAATVGTLFPSTNLGATAVNATWEEDHATQLVAAYQKQTAPTHSQAQDTTLLDRVKILERELSQLRTSASVHQRPIAPTSTYRDNPSMHLVSSGRCFRCNSEGHQARNCSWQQDSRYQSQRQTQWQPGTQSHTTHQHCYYHQRFGTQARNCTQPCSWGLKD